MRPITNNGARLSVALQRAVIPLLRTQHVLWFTRWDVWPDVWMELGPHFPLRGMLIWDKGDPGMGDLNHWGPSYRDDRVGRLRQDDRKSQPKRLSLPESSPG